MFRIITRTMLALPFAGTLLAASAGVSSLAAQQPTYKRDLPAALMKQATVTEPAAARLALASVRNGQIQAVELENEGGRLLYSYELKVPGRSGIEEVNVNAKTGKVVNTEHESPAAEGKEAAKEKGPKHD
jgi:uncharacterized membrane protein YkoI